MNLYRFTRYPDVGTSSLASFLAEGQRYGIYLYHFSDDSWYVGKSKDVAERHQQHVHEWRHREDYQDVCPEDFYFMEVDRSKGERYLDERETETIRWVEGLGKNLRNVAKTNLPRGTGSVQVTIEDALFTLPWDRSQATWGTVPSVVLGDGLTERQRRSFNRLKSAPFYSDLASCVGGYLRKTVPEAQATAGTLWSVSALPSTNGGVRLMTLSLANLETLYVIGSLEEGVEVVVVNAKKPEGDRKPDPCWYTDRHRAHYKASTGVVSYFFSGTDALLRGLENERFLDWAYRLNVELLRTSPTLFRKGFNALLAADLIEAMGPPGR